MEFQHLFVSYRIKGLYNSPYGKGKIPVIIQPSQKTIDNKVNKAEHADFLSSKSANQSSYWKENRENRSFQELPEVPDAIPLFFQVDPKLFVPENLRAFGIEVISQQENGFIVGASADIDLMALSQKIEKFIAEDSSYQKAAQLWNIVDGVQWRLDQIASKKLKDRWEEIGDDELLITDIAIACYVHVSDFPQKDERGGETESSFEIRVNRWEEKKRASEIERDEVSMKRETELTDFISGYNGDILSSFIDSADSFSCRIRICGKGLKDLLLNYPYLFEADLYEEISIDSSSIEFEETDSTLILEPPSEIAPKVCVIDSGIQEKHKLLSSAINPDHSLSYVPGEEDITSDQVKNGGHGTSVAGSVLFRNEIPSEGNHSHKWWIQNARILNGDNILDEKLFPPQLMNTIVEDFHKTHKTRIFNLSVNERVGHRRVHISEWAESIDRNSNDNDLLFVISVGNLFLESKNNSRPGVYEYINNGQSYPDYLFDNKSRLANPSQSHFSITVGSICPSEFENQDIASFGKKEHPSAFTRTGLGIWESIKPEVVEFGGDFVYEKNTATPNVSEKDEVSVDVVRSNLFGGYEKGVSNGTSFSTPKVASIAAELESLFPDETCLLYKALIIQSARWPKKVFESTTPRMNFLRLFGYGIPNLLRATENTDYRVTLVSSGEITPNQADIYEVKIPESIRKQGDTHRILIEVTMTFKAEPRMTRTGFRNYLSGWADWHSSSFGENRDEFEKRIIKRSNEVIGDDMDVEEDSSDQHKIPWTISSRSNSGIHGVKRNNSSVQKDWAVIKSHQMTDDFCIAVVGHKGWEKDLRKKIPYSVCVSFEALNEDIEIYNAIKIENEIQTQVKF